MSFKEYLNEKQSVDFAVLDDLTKDELNELKKISSALGKNYDGFFKTNFKIKTTNMLQKMPMILDWYNNAKKAEEERDSNLSKIETLLDNLLN